MIGTVVRVGLLRMWHGRGWRLLLDFAVPIAFSRSSPSSSAGRSAGEVAARERRPGRRGRDGPQPEAPRSPGRAGHPAGLLPEGGRAEPPSSQRSPQRGSCLKGDCRWRRRAPRLGGVLPRHREEAATSRSSRTPRTPWRLGRLRADPPGRGPDPAPSRPGSRSRRAGTLQPPRSPPRRRPASRGGRRRVPRSSPGQGEPVVSMYAAGIAVMFLLFGGRRGAGSLLGRRRARPSSG